VSISVKCPYCDHLSLPRTIFTRDELHNFLDEHVSEKHPEKLTTHRRNAKEQDVVEHFQRIASIASSVGDTIPAHEGAALIVGQLKRIEQLLGRNFGIATSPRRKRS
jgi:hypothetical protein